MIFYYSLNQEFNSQVTLEMEVVEVVVAGGEEVEEEEVEEEEVKEGEEEEAIEKAHHLD